MLYEVITIGGGGRYDGLVELLGGKPTPGVGFGSGIERLILVAEKNAGRRIDWKKVKYRLVPFVW